MTTDNGCRDKSSKCSGHSGNGNHKANGSDKIALLVENLRETYRWHGYLLEELSEEVKTCVSSGDRQE